MTKKDPPICNKCDKPMILISFWDDQKKINEYWYCSCTNRANKS